MFNRREQQQEQQNTTLAQAGQNFYRGGANVELTEPRLKFGLIALVIIIPMLMFILFVQPEGTLFHPAGIPTVSPGIWLNWVIIVSWTIISQVILTLVVNKNEKLKADVFMTGFLVMGLMAGWYGLPFHNLWKIMWAVLMGMGFQFLGRIVMGIRKVIPMIKQARMAQKQMMDMQMAMQEQQNPGSGPKTKEDFQKEQARRQEEQMRAQTEVLDQMLREQGIDIDALDKEFGSSLDTGKINSVDIMEEQVFDAQANSADTIKDYEDIEIVEVKEK